MNARERCVINIHKIPQFNLDAKKENTPDHNAIFHE